VDDGRTLEAVVGTWGDQWETGCPDDLWPGKVSAALRMWRYFVRNPYRRVWVDYPDGGCGIFECCGSPWEARDLLECVMTAMSERSSRELRRVVESA
jgi:hypothetical protein